VEVPWRVAQVVPHAVGTCVSERCRLPGRHPIEVMVRRKVTSLPSSYFVCPEKRGGRRRVMPRRYGVAGATVGRWQVRLPWHSEEPGNMKVWNVSAGMSFAHLLPERLRRHPASSMREVV